MFAKREAKGGSGLPAATPALTDQRKPPKVASVVADDIVVEGGFTGDGELHVDGTVKGDIRIGKLTLSETGQIQGNVYAEAVEIRGRIVGSITARQVRLFATAYVEGDVMHEQLAMETGAYFQGRSQKLQQAAPAAADAGEVIALQSATGS